ncbi:MAG: sensor histidine kinase, partial [Anaerolineae bacterium]
ARSARLRAAVAESAARYRQSGVQFTIHASGPLPTLPAAVEVAAYRIAQEAMTNVVRHAGAAACQVTLALEPGALCLTVADDGCGLPADIQPGIGLRSMQERVAELDGRFAIESHSGSGTKIKAALPLSVIRNR